MKKLAPIKNSNTKRLFFGSQLLANVAKASIFVAKSTPKLGNGKCLLEKPRLAEGIGLTSQQTWGRYHHPSLSLFATLSQD